MIPEELKQKPQCYCDHKLSGTGAIFLQSIGWLICNNCCGVQRIRKSLEKD